MPDPASINLTLHITGLSRTEASAVYSRVPAGCRIVAEVSQPASGGPRHTIEVSGLTSYGARDLTAALADHLTAIAEGDEPVPEWERELLAAEARKSDEQNRGVL